MSCKKNQLASIKEHKDTFDWILEKQAALRAELLTFYKKDLKEIQSALSVISENSSGESFTTTALKDVQKHFLNQWMCSYNLITPVEDLSGKDNEKAPEMQERH